MNMMSFISLGTGVSIFLFGMMLIRDCLQKNFKEKLCDILSRFTKNRFTAVFTGTVATFAMQSSSASSVLTASLVDCSILSLYRAFWIIVGANVGTTFTGLLTAIDFSAFAPVCCIFGIILLSFSKKSKISSVGSLVMGFGLLFVGMNTMSKAVSSVSESSFFAEILSSCSSPVSGVITGALFTAVIQSSSAVTALLQTLSFDGLIGIREAFYIILGSNIGTCATSAIASIGLNSSAKKVSIMHIMFNLIGSLLFLFISLVFPLPEKIAGICSGGIKTQIAVVNIIFNIVSALLALCLPIKEETFLIKRRDRHLLNRKAKVSGCS